MDSSNKCSEFIDFCKNINTSIEGFRNSGNSSACNFAITTISQVGKLFFNRDQISYINDDRERLNFANSITSGSGAERGFFYKGTNSSLVKKSIEYKVNILMKAFLYSKEMNDLKTIINVINQGDRCLTARIGRIEEYLASKIFNGFDKDQELRDEKIYAMPRVAISNAIWEIIDLENLSNMSDEYLETYIAYLKKKTFLQKKYSEILVEQFEILNDGKEALAFKQFLLKRNILIEDENSWCNIMKNQDIWERCFENGKKQAILEI